ncbi:MAG: nucleotidyltransferase domain-containing protein [Alphaproteobacteria bacterium]|nr:nucleotidyltransferase domain-containing protein [Alphaproteobacteria bacterium]
MSFGLPAESLAIVLTILRNHPAVESALIYGSRARGNYRPGSDIDLALAGESLSSDELRSIASDLDDSYLPYLVDLTLLPAPPNSLIAAEISRDGIEFYRR